MILLETHVFYVMLHKVLLNVAFLIKIYQNFQNGLGFSCVGAVSEPI